MLFHHPLVSVLCRTGRRNADGQDVVFHVLAHRVREHVYLSVLRQAGEGCVQEISVAGILLAAVVVCVCHPVDRGIWYLVISHDVEHDSVA